MKDKRKNVLARFVQNMYHLYLILLLIFRYSIVIFSYRQLYINLKKVRFITLYSCQKCLHAIWYNN